MAKTIDDTYGLSPMQHGMLFHSLYSQKSGVDIEQVVCRLQEELNVSAFRQAWDSVVARHAALRTSFRWDGSDEPLQDVHRSVNVDFEQQDWRGLSPSEQKVRLDSYLRSDRKRGFALGIAPLMRLALFRVGPADYQLIWTSHHILADGRSQLLILKEVFAFYEAFCRHKDFRADQPRPYGDHIRWLQQQDLSKGEVFWRRILKGFTTPTSLSVARAPTQQLDQQDERGEQEVSLSMEATSELRSLAQKHRLTLNTFVQGAWALLLSRYSGDEDVVFGAIRACRQSTVQGSESIVGMFINTLPVRAQVSPERPLLPWLEDLRAQSVAVRDYEHTPLVMVQGWSERRSGTSLFETILVFDNYLLDSALRAQGGNWEAREFRLLEKTNYPLTVYGYAETALLLKIAYDRHRFDDATVAWMLGSFKSILEGMATHPECRLSELPQLSAAEQHQLIVKWNDTQVDYAKDSCIHHLFEDQAARTPDAVALVVEDSQLTYRELNCRANQVAHRLRKLGVGPGVLVGISMERSLEMVVGLLSILKAGGAYVPLDPAYPKERLAFMMEDCRAAVILTQRRLIGLVPNADGQPSAVLAPQSSINNRTVICLDVGWEAIAGESAENLNRRATSDDLAYVIYTSGSTGKPKGVLVGHRNVVNFFAGMDRCIGNTPGVWLAVTSISFDISALELFWTLARGFQVILQVEPERAFNSPAPNTQISDKGMDFSLFYFASNEEKVSGGKYRLLIEGAKFADQHGFSAVWTPERHFHPFGGLYPNPSLTSAAIAAVTERIQIRAGSVVLPLQSPIRVAEEWSVVDNLSNGRVGVSFASGWHANDFVFAPENYAGRKEIMFRQIETVRRLWRGEAVPFKGGVGNEVEVRIFPQPIQQELPVWVTAAGTPETFRLAGEIGANLLTHLLGQSLEDLAERISIYRKSWREHGHGPGEGHVTLMLHTFIGEDIDTVREKVREPFTNYLKSSSDLVRNLVQSLGQDAGSLTEDDMKPHWDRAFNRYFDTSGLLGTPGKCLQMIERFKAVGVDEVACLIDFGVDSDSVLSNLHYLDLVRGESNKKRQASSANYSLSSQITRHRVSHLQCTPSMARMLTTDTEALSALKVLRQLLLGGEALPVSLAEQLSEVMSGEIHNMYGPTETTIWSTMGPVGKNRSTISIGRPIANTEIYLLDRHFQPVPMGVAGELFIGGAGVVRGYHNRPELTAERFIPDPFSAEAGARMYRTGDLGRYLPDGNIEFLGRLDYQVKIRGHRVELGEIEAVLEEHPAIKESVVIAREDTAGDKYLVTYLVAGQEPLPSIIKLRSFLEEKLPEHMVPSTFVTLGSLPLTPNGKLDRQALPAPDQGRPELEKPFVAPRDAIEAQLAKIWEKVLGRQPIGGEDNFFELGGHSLRAVQVVQQIGEVFGKKLPVIAIFQAPTIEQLAEVLREEDSSRDWASFEPLQPNGSKPPFFFLAGRSHFGDRLGPDQPVYRVVYQDLDREQPFVRVEDMATYAIKTVRRIQPDGPYYLGGHSQGGMVAFEMAQQMQRQGEKVALLALCECWTQDSRPPTSGTSSAYRLWKKVNYHFHRTRRVGARQELNDFLGSLEKKTQGVAWRKQVVPQAQSQQAHRAAIFAALRQYVPQAYAGGITVIRCAEHVPWKDYDPLYGWARIARDGVEAYEIPGSHAGIYREPNVEILAKTLNDVLRKAQATPSSEPRALDDPSVPFLDSRPFDGLQNAGTEVKNQSA
jgi:natural product biosynthesis luciferase-like monooxygenase protein